jgi:hypothetical protein
MYTNYGNTIHAGTEWMLHRIGDTNWEYYPKIALIGDPRKISVTRGKRGSGGPSYVSLLLQMQAGINYVVTVLNEGYPDEPIPCHIGPTTIAGGPPVGYSGTVEVTYYP